MHAYGSHYMQANNHKINLKQTEKNKIKSSVLASSVLCVKWGGGYRGATEVVWALGRKFWKSADKNLHGVCTEHDGGCYW